MNLKDVTCAWARPLLTVMSDCLHEFETDASESKSLELTKCQKTCEMPPVKYWNSWSAGTRGTTVGSGSNFNMSLMSPSTDVEAMKSRKSENNQHLTLLIVWRDRCTIDRSLHQARMTTASQRKQLCSVVIVVSSPMTRSHFWWSNKLLIYGKLEGARHTENKITWLKGKHRSHLSWFHRKIG